MGTDIEKESTTLVLRKYGQFFKTQLQDLASVTRDELWNDNKSFAPIQLILEPSEKIPLIQLVSSDNTMMTKVLSVLSSLCVEIIHLKNEAYER